MRRAARISPEKAAANIAEFVVRPRRVVRCTSGYDIGRDETTIRFDVILSSVEGVKFTWGKTSQLTVMQKIRPAECTKKYLRELEHDMLNSLADGLAVELRK